MSIFRNLANLVWRALRPARRASPAERGSAERGTADPQSFLFTTPTLNDALPVSSGPKVGDRDCCRIHEDDWRQFEFVDAALRREVARELAEIDTIWKQHSVPLKDEMIVFRKVHVRKLIPQPLEIEMSGAEFEQLLGSKSKPLAFLFEGCAVPDVYAVALDNVVFYAAIHDNRLMTLAMDTPGQFVLPEDVGERLENFLTEHNLLLVHWRSRTLFESPQIAADFLRGRNT